MATVTNTILPLLLVMAVTLSGAHAKELSSLRIATLPSSNKKMVSDDAANSNSNIKIHHDPHTHVDKQVLKSSMHVNDTDNRSMRLMEQRNLSYGMRLSLNWRALLRSLLRLSYA